MSQISEKIRTGKIDPNSRQLFFSKLIKALLVNLNHNLKIHGKPVPHIIFNTGDDRLYLEEMDYDYSKEPSENTNTQYTYSEVPRCAVQISSLDVLTDQLTSPYSRGIYEIIDGDSLYSISSEFRRMPVKVGIELSYILNNFTESLDLMQFIVTHLAFVQTFKFDYLGQTILASYTLPESQTDEHQTELTGSNSDERNHTVNISLEVESNIPVFESRTAVETRVITTTVNNLSDKKHGDILDVRLEHGGKLFRNPGSPDNPVDIDPVIE